MLGEEAARTRTMLQLSNPVREFRLKTVDTVRRVLRDGDFDEFEQILLRFWLHRAGCPPGQKQNEFEKSSKEVRNGVITNWDDMSRLWRHAFSQLGVTNYEEHKVHQNQHMLWTFRSPFVEINQRSRIANVRLILLIV